MSSGKLTVVWEEQSALGKSSMGSPSTPRKRTASKMSSQKSPKRVPFSPIDNNASARSPRNGKSSTRTKGKDRLASPVAKLTPGSSTHVRQKRSRTPSKSPFKAQHDDDWGGWVAAEDTTNSPTKATPPQSDDNNGGHGEGAEYDQWGFLTNSDTYRIRYKHHPVSEVVAPREDTEEDRIISETWWSEWCLRWDSAIASTQPAGDAPTGEFRHPLQSPPKCAALSAATVDKLAALRTEGLDSVFRWGIPHQLRKQIWPRLAETNAYRDQAMVRLHHESTTSEQSSYYLHLLQACGYEHPVWSRVIRLDLDRTFATHRDFRPPCAFGSEDGNGSKRATSEVLGEGQRHLFNVLTAYSHYNPAIGYCQGMSFLVATLLMIFDMEEEEAFWMLAAIMDGPRYKMEPYFSPGMKGLLQDSTTLQKLAETAMPALYRHLVRDMPPLVLTRNLSKLSDAFHSVCGQQGSWPTTLRIWDLFFCEGLSSLPRVTLGILQACEQDIIAMQGIERVMPYILNLPAERIIPGILMPVIKSIDLSQLQLQLEFEEIRQRNQQSATKTPRAQPHRPVSAQASVPPVVATPSTNKGLLSRLWDKIATPSKAAVSTQPGYVRVASTSPPALLLAQATAASALSARAKRKRGEGEVEPAIIPQNVVSPIGTPMKRLSSVFDTVAPSPDDFDSPAKRRKSADEDIPNTVTITTRSSGLTPLAKAALRVTERDRQPDSADSSSITFANLSKTDEDWHAFKSFSTPSKNRFR